MKRLKIYRLALIFILAVVIIFTATFYIYDIKNSLPESLKIVVGSDSEFDFNLPIEADVYDAVETLTISNASSKESGSIHFSMGEPFTVTSGKTGSYKMKLKLFGLFELKNISIDVIDNMSLLPCGNAVGIHVDTDGLLVLGTGAVTGKDGLEYEPAYNIVNSGDYIRGVASKRINSIKQLQKEIQNCGEDNVVIDICRNDIESSISLPVVEGEDGVKRIGVWVREDTQGIGTLTYIAPDGSFGALGHGITDIDTGVLMKLKEGSIYNTEIIQIIKGGKGNPGEIMGMILESPEQKIGDITSNTELGIGGVTSSEYDTSNNKYGYIPIALRQDVKKGPAVILSQLGDEIEEYDIEIVEVKKGSSDNKGMVIKITDEELIEKAGGIIQGMSGSPIIQNGKIVGAVTHVFVDDPGKGYGIFIENMLDH